MSSNTAVSLWIAIISSFMNCMMHSVKWKVINCKAVIVLILFFGNNWIQLMIYNNSYWFVLARKKTFISNTDILQSWLFYGESHLSVKFCLSFKGKKPPMILKWNKYWSTESSAHTACVTFKTFAVSWLPKKIWMENI